MGFLQRSAKHNWRNEEKQRSGNNAKKRREENHKSEDKIRLLFFVIAQKKQIKSCVSMIMLINLLTVSEIDFGGNCSVLR